MMDARRGPLFWDAMGQVRGRAESLQPVDTTELFGKVGDKLRYPEGWDTEWERGWRDLLHVEWPTLRDQGWLDAITSDVRNAGELLWLLRTGRATLNTSYRP